MNSDTAVVLADRVDAIRNAIAGMRKARDELRAAGAGKAADYVARALKSAEGALRHVQGRVDRARATKVD